MYGTTMRNYNANRASGTKDEKRGFFSKKSIAKENKRAKKNEDTRYMKLESSAEIAAYGSSAPNVKEPIGRNGTNSTLFPLLFHTTQSSLFPSKVRALLSVPTKFQRHSLPVRR